jgi:hypothetical protein
MNPFPWRAPELEIKLALHPRSWFSPVIEQCRPPCVRQLLPHTGYYFGLGSWDSQEGRRGYIASLEFHSGFREREFPIEDLWELEKTLSAISISLGASLSRG